MERILQKPLNGKPLSKPNQKLLEHILALKAALMEHQREPYLQHLADREQETQRWLEKHMTICFQTG